MRRGLVLVLLVLAALVLPRASEAVSPEALSYSNLNPATAKGLRGKSVQRAKGKRRSVRSRRHHRKPTKPVAAQIKPVPDELLSMPAVDQQPEPAAPEPPTSAPLTPPVSLAQDSTVGFAEPQLTPAELEPNSVYPIVVAEAEPGLAEFPSRKGALITAEPPLAPDNSSNVWLVLLGLGLVLGLSLYKTAERRVHV